MKTGTILLAALAAAALTACGGGGGSDAPAPAANEVPASATASPLAYAQYAASLPLDDHAQPLSVDKVVPPVTETGAPMTW